MKTKSLGIFALIGAPFLFVDMFVGAKFPHITEFAPWFSGVAGLLYISGWLASIENLRRAIFIRKQSFGWYAIRIQMFSLAIANISNIWAIVSTSKPTLYYILDAAWPVSHLLMFPLAWVVIKNGALKGFRQFLPLLIGLWLPVCMLLGRNDFALYFGGIYSALVWSLFAIAAMNTQNNLFISYLSFNHKQNLN